MHIEQLPNFCNNKLLITIPLITTTRLVVTIIQWSLLRYSYVKFNATSVLPSLPNLDA